MDDFWGAQLRIERAYFRAHNLVGRVSLPKPDDTGAIQLHQLTGYTQTEVADELRDPMQRYQTFGLATVPLPGGKGVAVYQSGHRGFGTVIADEDPRYRPRNQKPGEILHYIVDGAQSDGTGGTMRQILKGALGWVSTLFGKTINCGDSNTTMINVGTSGTVTINIGGTSAPNVIIKASTKVTVTVPECDISNGGTLQPVKLADGTNSTVLKAQ